MQASFPILPLLVLALVLAGLILVGILLFKTHWSLGAGYIVVLVSPVLWLAVVVIHPFGPVDALRVVAEATAEDGTTAVLTQSRNDYWAEPYTVALWLRPPGEPWHWFYVDHQSGWWRSGRIEMDGERGEALIRSGSKRFATLDLETRTLTREDGFPARVATPVDPEWELVDRGEYFGALGGNFRGSPMSRGAASNRPPGSGPGS